MQYIYKITNILDNKIYIGQTNKPEYRWYQHRSYAADGNKHKQYIHNAIAKHGIENFIFEVIDVGLDRWQADCLELNYIKTYDSRNVEHGYNIKPGGNTSPLSEETKEKIRQATLNQIATQGHPATGRVVSEAERELHRQDRLQNPLDYTPELRKKMSEAHLGNKPSEEAVRKQSESLTQWWEKRNAERFATEEIYCHAPGCEVSGKAKYKIINSVRYCNKHGLRMLRYGRLNALSD